MAKEKIIELPPVRESSEDYEALERELIRFWRKQFYAPLMAELKLPVPTKVSNSRDGLKSAIRSGRVWYKGGRFGGRFSSEISKELRDYGAKWDRRTRTYRLDWSLLDRSLIDTIRTSEVKFQEKLAGFDKKLSRLMPKEMTEKLSLTKTFDTQLWRVAKQFETMKKRITVGPELSKEARMKVAREWSQNMKLWVQNWTEEEILKLRKDVEKHVFRGGRMDELSKILEKSYGSSQVKAKFLARQETNLLMAKFKESRWKDAGVKEYRWSCVVGSPKHPVRPSHKALDGKIFSFDNPPITTGPGEPLRRNNPGEDYGCRCAAIPIVRVKG